MTLCRIESEGVTSPGEWQGLREICSTVNYSLPLRVSREDIDNLPPLEKAYAEYLIETKPGEVFILVDDPAWG